MSSFENIKLAGNQFVFTFEMKYVIYQNEDYFVAKVKPKLPESYSEHMGGSSCTVTGHLNNPTPNDFYQAIGTWINDKKGWHIDIILIKEILPDSNEGLKKFLKKYCKGIGDKTIDKILKAYGSSVLDKIRESVGNLTVIQGISIKKAEKIRNAILNHEDFENLSVFFMENGIYDFKKILKVYEKLKPNPVSQISESPYVLCKILGVDSFSIADRIYINSANASGKVRLAYGIYYYIVSQTEKKGHVFSYKSDIFDNINAFLSRYGVLRQSYSFEHIEISIDYLLSNGLIFIDYDSNNNECVYLSQFYVVEERTVSLLKDFCISKNSCTFPQSSLDKFLKKKNDVDLDKLQIEALKLANENKIMILTGGPGSGKTFTINMIIEFFKFCNSKINIKLAAPTGRAAKRITELTGMEAFTIHRLLNIGVDESYNFSQKDDSEFDADILIIDEFSMIDIFLFYKILTVLDGTKTKLIISGDYNQLPSVKPGLVLKNLISSNYLPTVKLNRIFRQAENSQIITNSYKILDGLGSSDFALDYSKNDFYLIPQNNQKDIINSLILNLKHFLSLGISINDVIVLSSMSKGDLGSVSFNNIIQNVLNPSSPLKPEIRNISFTLRVGDRVMQIKNDYDLVVNEGADDEFSGVFNGEIGYLRDIETIDNETILYVEYDDGIVKYTKQYYDSLSLAYAITVHKSQGSEFPYVFMPVHNSLVNLDKNILFTGITRAKNTVVLIGDTNYLDYSVTQDFSVNRNSILDFKLQKANYTRN